MAHAPGYNKLIEWTDAPIMPTPGAVGNILQTIAERQGITAVGVDIGGATTDVFSVFRDPDSEDPVFNRTVSANLGMSYSISNVCAEATLPMISKVGAFRHGRAGPQKPREEQNDPPHHNPANARGLNLRASRRAEALRLAYIQHKEFATTLKGVQQQRTVGDTFSQQTSGQTIVDNMKLNLLVASGGVLSHAPRMHQTAAMLVDAFEPEGFTTLAKDSIFMMPHLGVLAQVHPAAALEVFERDCLIYLGTCIAPAGTGKPGKACFKYQIEGGGLSEQGELAYGEMKLFPLAEDQTAEVEIDPAKGFNMGAGSGKAIKKTVKGGTVGLILDARGRPLSLPQDPVACRSAVKSWIDELQLYPE